MKVGFEAIPLARKELSGIGVYAKNTLSNIRKNPDLTAIVYNPFFFRPGYVSSHVPGLCVRNILAPLWVSARHFDVLWYNVLLPAVLRKERLDLFHGLSAAVPETKQTRLVLTVHDLHPFFERTKVYISTFKERLAKSIAMADAVVCVSNFTKEELLKNFTIPERKIAVVPEAADQSFFERPQEEARQFLASFYGIQEDFIFFPADFYPRKNHLFLLENFFRLRQQGFPYNLILTGKSTPYSGIVRRFVTASQHRHSVKILGYIPSQDMPYFYSAAKFLVYPSLYEGFGLPVVEAMACGCPVVCSALPVLREISHDSALFFNPESSDEIENAFERIQHEDERLTLVQKARAHAQSFSWEKAAQTLVRLYEQVCGREVSS